MSILAVTLVPLLGLGLVAPANAGQVSHPSVVTDDPANWTPNVMDGQVNALAKLGDTIYVGGQFSQVVEPRGAERDLVRHNLFAFDISTREVVTDFVPAIDGEVNSLTVDPGTGTLFVGGAFTAVNGSPSRSIAAIDASDGSSRAGFTPPGLNAPVNDVHLVGNRLFIGGPFTYVGPTQRTALASLNATTGAITGYLDAGLTTTREGQTSVLKMAVSPDEQSLVVIGNFTSAFGSVRHQIAMLNLDGGQASLAGWSTAFYSGTCSSAFDTYLRDLDISPDGSYFVVSTTGAYRSPPAPCDTQARFEYRPSRADADPTWVSYTGGDTTYAVSITGTAVYVGGHMRWFNNPYARDSAGPGAVPRSGLAALDPRNGIPLTWDPGRTRGVGVFDMMATDDGLWIASDTDRVNDERHGRIAFFPLAGGERLPAEKVGAPPNDAYLLGNRTAGGDKTLSRWVHFDGGASVPTDAQELLDDQEWERTRGAVLIDDQLYTGLSDGTFARRTFTGDSFGEAQQVELYGGSFAEDLATVTGMFFDKGDGRLYYTMNGVDSLFWRAFSPQSAIVGATRFTVAADATALYGSHVAGMFLDGDTLYFANRATGELKSLEFSAGETRGPARLVNDSVNWRSRGTFVSNREPRVAAYTPPTAAMGTPDCQYLACSFDGSASEAQGSAMDYSWEFGDGSTGTGPTPEHSYPAAGAYSASLTVADRLGGTDTATSEVAVVAPPKRAVVKVGTRDSRNILFVNVNPNVGEDYWRFRVKKKVDGQWEWRKTYRTRGPKEIRRIDLKKGTYRVRVLADHGRRGVTSSSVTLLR